MSGIDWKAVESAIESMLEDATGLKAVKRDGPRPFAKSPRKQKALALYKIITRRGVGVDEVRYTDNGAAAPDPSCVPTACGIRTFTLSLQVLSYTQDPNREAACYLEEVRTCVRLPQVLECLQQAGLALIEVLPTTPLDYEADDRVYSRANMDMRFSVAATKTGDAIQNIETVVISSEFRGVDGNILPSPPNVTNQEIP